MYSMYMYFFKGNSLFIKIQASKNDVYIPSITRTCTCIYMLLHETMFYIFVAGFGQAPSSG